jgi:hypothetical protein
VTHGIERLPTAEPTTNKEFIACGSERPFRKTLCQLPKGHSGSCQAVIFWEQELLLCVCGHKKSYHEIDDSGRCEVRLCDCVKYEVRSE